MDSGFLSSPPESSESDIFTTGSYNQSYSYSTPEQLRPLENTCGNPSFNGLVPTTLQRDSFPASGPVCIGCGGSIRDQYILRVAPNLEWHAQCLKCTECGQKLDENCTCFVKCGKTYCKQDYARLFGAKCNKCGLGFSKDDFVMKAKEKVYHVNCFRCMVCQKQLQPGEEFAVRENGLMCRADYHLYMTSDMLGNVQDFHSHKYSPPGVSSSGGVIPSPINGLHTPVGISGHSRHIGSGHKRKDTKTTRVRTVLNEKQLHTLRSCYAANCRPDALMKEQLTEITGLSARVIRVWFQNKRCKDKKRSIALKQLQEQQAKQQKIGEQNGSDPSSSLTGINGVQMIASEPVRNDSANPKPVQIQNYQQPSWKSLGDLSLQSNLEQPAFQQLMRDFSDHGQSSISDSSECSFPPVSPTSTSCSTPITVESSASVCG